MSCSTDSRRKRHFSSTAVEKAIHEFKANVKQPELAWLFENCFPNTLDTTVYHTTKEDRPDTYVITGDIDAMWLRDSSAQVWPYLQFMKQDRPLQWLVAGVINHQTACILKDPYANAFYNDPQKQGEWTKDLTDMKPGVHERKWEIDSLCYPIRLAWHYWKLTGILHHLTNNGRKLSKPFMSLSAISSVKQAMGITSSSATRRWQRIRCL
nr:glycoside hydrolase family 125 protein [Paraflavitalea speifideiaquila]